MAHGELIESGMPGSSSRTSGGIRLSRRDSDRVFQRVYVEQGEKIALACRKISSDGEAERTDCFRSCLARSQSSEHLVPDAPFPRT